VDSLEWANGSSPRVRGTLIGVAMPVGAERFIPACAGNAPEIDPLDPGMAVHPRVCGERCQAIWRGDLSHGSSPRVRGTQFWERLK